MKLDSRIIKGKKPLSCFDTEQAKEFLDKECYFSDHLCTFNELLDAYSYVTADILVSKEKHLYVGELLTVGDSNESCYEAGINGEAEWFQFCLPCEWVKEPEQKYRPLTLNEFQDQFHFGICIILRPKNDRSMEFHVTYNGYKVLTDRNIVELYLGPAIFTLPELYEEYERFENGRWKPFGIEVKE